MPKTIILPSALVGWLLVISSGVHAGSGPAHPAWGEPSQNQALTALVRESVESNPRVQAAGAALVAAKARERGASQPLYNPELELDYENAEARTSSIGISQTIDWTDKRGARADIAAAERESRAAELAAIRQSLASELLSALINFHTRDELSRMAQKRTELTQQILLLATKRNRAGDLPQVEFDLAQLTSIQARIQQALAAASRAEALHGVISIVGYARPGWPVFVDEAPAPVPEHLDVDTLITGLPSLRAQQARVNAARINVQLKIRERRPDPTFALRGGREGSDDLIGLTLSIPLFVRNKFSAEVDASSADSLKTKHQLSEMTRRARTRLLSTTERYRLTQNAWMEWLQTGYVSLQSQTDLLQRLWQAGELNTTDYLLQLNQSIDTQVNALELRGSVWQGWIDWLAASGQVEVWLGYKSDRTLNAR